MQTALSYLEANVDAYVTQVGADGPGQLALLILDAEAGGVNPTSFGGTNLVSRLLATEQPSGLFGTDTQLANFAAGNYEQGLALAGARGGWGQRPGAASARPSTTWRASSAPTAAGPSPPRPPTPVS